MTADATLPDSTDVVIVGGGVMGTSAAYFLSEHTDRDVLLLEQDSISSGSSGDSSAIIRHLYGPQSHYTETAWWSHGFYREFEAETGYPIAYRSNPYVRFVESGTQAAEYAMEGYETLQEFGIPCSIYRNGEIEEEYPMLVHDRYDIAVSDDSAAFSDGTDVANGFARAARDNGATVQTGLRVEGIGTRRGAITGVETETRRIDCEDLILAAGPWTPEIASTVGLTIPLSITREQVIILDPPDQYADRYPDLTPTTALPGGTWYLRPDFGGSILVATHHTDDIVDPSNYKNQPDEDMLLNMMERLEQVLPGLAEAGIQGQYCGVYSTTPDHDFIIDQAGPDGCYIACGFSGHGFKHSPAIGRILKDLLVHGTTELVDTDYFRLSRFDDDPEGHGLPSDYA